MNKKLLKKVIFVALLAFTLFMIASPVFADMPDIPENVLSSDCEGSDPTLTSTHNLLIIIAISVLLLVPFFVLEGISIKNQKHIDETTDEESIKKANKFQVTLSIWSTIFLILWLLFGFYILLAADYYYTLSAAFTAFAFFSINIFIILLKIVNLIRFKSNMVLNIFHIILLLGFVIYYYVGSYTSLYYLSELL